MNFKESSLVLVYFLCILTFFPVAGEGAEKNLRSNNNELATRNEVINKTFYLFWHRENFAFLNKVAEQFRDNKERTGSGLWKLSFFYHTFDVAADIEEDQEYWENIKTKTNKWLEEFPDTPTPYIAHAIVLRKYAWKIRGAGYADTVQKEAWAPFYERLEEARTFLQKNKKIASTDPHWYVEMATIAVAEEWPKSYMDELIEEGVEKEPYYYPIYFAGMDYYSPKWHGDADAIEKWADFAVKKTSSKEGLGLYARIYWYAYSTFYLENLFLNSNINWVKMKKGMDDVLASYPNPWNINHFAKFSCMARDQNKTAELTSLIKGKPILQVWGSKEQYKKCIDWDQ